MPILKHHGSSGLTIAMKNLYGILGGNRGKLHRDMGENIADLANGFRSHLVVVDAYRVLMRNGPVGGRLSDVELRQTVIASTHIMHADVAAAALFGRDPREVEFLQAAYSQENGRDRDRQDPGEDAVRLSRPWTPKRASACSGCASSASSSSLWLFFFLLLQSGGTAVEHLPHTGFFFYIDPLILWVNLLAGPFLHAFLLALVPLLLTLVFGRFFCGWVCPFGALNQFFTWLGSRRGRKTRSRSSAAAAALEIPAADRAAGRLAVRQPAAGLARSLFAADAQRFGRRGLPGSNFLAQHALQSGAAEPGLGGQDRQAAVRSQPRASCSRSSSGPSCRPPPSA